MPHTLDVVVFIKGEALHVESERLSQEALQARAIALPLAETGKILDDTEALHILEVLKISGSIVPSHVIEQTKRLLKEVVIEFPEIEVLGIVTLTEHQVRGLLARAAIAGSAQAVSDLGEAQKTIEKFKIEYPSD